jgi:hypothetical protein
MTVLRITAHFVRKGGIILVPLCLGETVSAGMPGAAMGPAVDGGIALTNATASLFLSAASLVSTTLVSASWTSTLIAALLLVSTLLLVSALLRVAALLLVTTLLRVASLLVVASWLLVASLLLVAATMLLVVVAFLSDLRL